MTSYNRIKDLREDNDYTQEQISKILNVKRYNYAKWENGDRNISLKIADELSILYNVPLAYILI